MTCDELAQDIAAKARMPGWWQYARHLATKAEADDYGQWMGLRAKVRQLLGDFRPSPEEAKEWHIDLSLDERIALAGREKQGLRKPRHEATDNHQRNSGNTERKPKRNDGLRAGR